MVTFREIIQNLPASLGVKKERRTVVGSFAPFRRDIYKWRFLDPHEEMRQNWEMYMYNAFVNAAINTLLRFITGNKIGVSSEDQDTAEFLEKYLSKRGFENQMVDVILKTLICGNGYLEIDYDPMTGLPDKFYSVADPSRIYINFDKYGNPKTDEEAYLQRVDPIYNEPDARWYELSYHIGYSYHKIRIKAIPIHFLKLIHFRLNLSINGVYGRANIASVINDNETLMEMERAIAVIAKFRAVPKKLISYGTAENPATPEEMNALAAYLDNLLPEENAIINKEFKMEDLSFSGKTEGFTDYLHHIRRKIIAGNSPEFLLGLGDEVNRATAHEQLVAFLMGVESDRKIFTNQIEELILKPIIRYYNSRGGIVTKEGRKLLSENVSVKFGDIDFETRQEKVNRVCQLWTSNAITLNELRDELGLERVEDGDVYYADWNAKRGIQVNPTADMPNVKPVRTEPTHITDIKPYEPKDEPIGYQPTFNPTTSSFIEGYDGSTELDPAGISYIQMKYANAVRAKFVQALTPLFEKINLTTSERLKEDFAPSIIEASFNPIPNICMGEIEGMINEAYTKGWKEARKRMFLTNAQVAPSVMSRLKEEVFEKVTTLTKKEKVKFKKMLEEYLSKRKMIRAITPMKDFIEEVAEALNLTIYEAERLVRTEIVRLHSEGVRDAVLSNPDYPQRLEWHTSLLENVCPVCKSKHLKVYPAKSIELPPAHPNCLIDYQSPVLTDKGYKAIGKIREGDLVLTKEGKFRIVTKIFRGKHKDKVVRIWFGNGKGQKISLTSDHPVMTSEGWKKAEDITEKDLIMVKAKHCKGCGKQIPDVMGKGPFCSQNCAHSFNTKAQWERIGEKMKNSLKNHKSWNKGLTKEVDERVRKNGENIHLSGRKKFVSVLVGRYLFSGDKNPAKKMEVREKIRNSEYHRAGTWTKQKEKYPGVMEKRNETYKKTLMENPEKHPNRILAKNGGISKPQKMLYENVKNIFPSAELNHPIKTKTGVRYGDIVIADKKICIEYDGKYWHKDKEKDLKRDLEIQNEGYTLIKFNEDNVHQWKEVLDAVMMNHNDEYEFMFIRPIRVDSYTPKKTKTTYNLEVSEFNNYIVKGIVVHNCSCTVVPVKL